MDGAAPLSLIGFFLFFVVFFLRPVRRFVFGACLLVVVIGMVMLADGGNEHAPMMTGFFGIIAGALLVTELVVGAVSRRREDARMRRNIAAVRSWR